jgi:hypothetical protein
MFELLRKLLLFTTLFVVGMGTYLGMRNSTDWRDTLWVQVYPINGDGLETSSNYIRQLKAEDFAGIEDFMQREAERYRVGIEQPVKVVMGSMLKELPPAPPIDGHPLEIAFWSLKLRWWASRITANDAGPKPDIRMFLVYFDPKYTAELGHSLGLQKGLLGIVNLFASDNQRATNNFVIAHEMLHTLGATDKYRANNLPAYPEGYADPEKTPLYPQTHAEIMGGRIALSDSDAQMPSGLKQSLVGFTTAEEIRWIR